LTENTGQPFFFNGCWRSSIQFFKVIGSLAIGQQPINRFF